MLESYREIKKDIEDVENQRGFRGEWGRYRSVDEMVKDDVFKPSYYKVCNLIKQIEELEKEGLPPAMIATLLDFNNATKPTE